MEKILSGSGVLYSMVQNVGKSPETFLEKVEVKIFSCHEAILGLVCKITDFS